MFVLLEASMLNLHKSHFLHVQERVLMKDKSHFTEIIQQTRIELENGDISYQELESSIRVCVQHLPCFMD